MRRRAKGTTTERGYGSGHQYKRAAWAAKVEAGHAFCHAAICLMPGRLIQPGTAWDLGHTPDRATYTGPEHRKCNRAEGAARGNRMRGARRAMVKAQDGRRTIAPTPAPLRTSRAW